MIEINAQPTRLDLDWTYVRKAKAMGIPIVINPDAHSTDQLHYLGIGVRLARKGWLSGEGVRACKRSAGRPGCPLSRA